MKFVRERIVSQGGRYKDADLVHYTTEQTKRLARTQRNRLTPEKIRRQNEKNRERYLRQLLNTNFTDADFRVDLTYTDRELPGSRAEAKRDLRDYLERLRRLFRKRGAALRYVRVTGGGREKDRGEGLTRLHHHVIVGGADGRITREEIEDIWKKGRGETRRLRAEEDGYTGLAIYLLRHKKDCEKNEPVYKGSRSLRAPAETRTDGKFSERDMRRLERAGRAGTLREEFEKIYRGWECVSAEASVCEITGWTNFYARLRRKE